MNLKNKSKKRLVLSSINLIDLAILLPLWLVMGLIWQQMIGLDKSGLWLKDSFLIHDWSFHLGAISNFVFRKFILNGHPLFLHEPFRYHFTFDFLSACLIKLGLSIPQAIISLGLICSLGVTTLIYLFYRDLFRQRLSAALASILFIANGQGSFGAFWLVSQALIQQKIPAHIFVPNQLDWGNFLSHEIFRQPAFILGLPLSLVILRILWQFYQQEFKCLSPRTLMFMGIILGLMPLIHSASFLTLIFIISFTAAFSFLKKPSTLIQWLWLFIPAVILVYLISKFIFQSPPQLPRFQPGWIVSGTNESLAWFWFKSLGVMFLLIPWGFLVASKRVKVFSLPFWLIFIITNIFIIHPYQWDNRKYLLFWYLLAAGLAGNFLSLLIRQKKFWLTAVTLLILFLATASGINDLIKLILPSSSKGILTTSAEIQLAQEIRSKTSPESIFLTAPTGSANGLANILGRQIIMYSPGLAKSYGFASQSVNQDIKTIYEAKENLVTTSLIQKYQLNYIIVGPAERNFTTVNTQFFSRHFPLLIQNSDTQVFSVNLN